jgi:hypothetical protein
MTPSEDIIDKIRKLLRLAQGATNSHEAGLALERALQLAARHKIDVAGLDLDPEIERIIHERFPIGERLSYISKLTLNVVVEFFHVDVCVRKPDVVFAGAATDVTIAYYIFGFLSGSCRRALSAFEKEKKRKPSQLRRQNFVAGWIRGIRAQLNRAQKETLALEDNKFALALADHERRRRQYMDELIPHQHAIRTPPPRSVPTAAMAGFLEGRTTSIRTPLNPAPEVLRLE